MAPIYVREFPSLKTPSNALAYISVQTVVFVFEKVGGKSYTNLKMSLVHGTAES